MSYGFAGALAGLGKGMENLAADKRAQAARLLEMETKHKNDLELVGARASAKRSGKGGSGGSGGSGYVLSPRDRDDLARVHKGMLATGDFGLEAPTEAQLGSRVEQIRSENRNLSLSAAIDLAASDWGEISGTETVTEERGVLNPMRYIEGATYEEEKPTSSYGFKQARAGEAPAPGGNAPAPGRAAPAPSAKGMSAGEKAKILDDARAAIAQGASADAVKQRLIDANIDPKEL